MVDDGKDMLHGLFATATALLEVAIDTTISAQSIKRTPDELILLAQRLEDAAQDVGQLARAAVVLANLAKTNHL